jgi:hypothetical protein
LIGGKRRCKHQSARAVGKSPSCLVVDFPGKVWSNICNSAVSFKCASFSILKAIEAIII